MGGQYLQRRGGTWSVVLDVPRAVREEVGTKRFVKALGTSSLAQANVLKLPYLMDWQKRIAVADEGKVDPETALMREAVANQADDTRHMEHNGHESTNADEFRGVIVERAKEILDQFGKATADTFLKVSTSAEAVVENTYSLWLAQSMDAAHAKVQHEAAVKRFMGWAGATATVKLPRKRAGEYINYLLATDDPPKLSRRTVERHASSLSSLWRWYIARGMAEDSPWRGHQLTSKKLNERTNGTA
jgi:hypothetical protein